MEILGEGWNSRLGVILAVAGSAVGLGNFLRFPGQAVANGGGAFMIPYLCALLLLGIPICWAEWTMGRYGGARGFHSSPAIMGVVGRGAVPRYFGVLGLLIPLVIFMYYGLVESWCLRYAWAYASGAMDLGSDVSAYTGASQAFFSEISGSSQHGVIVDGHLDAAVVFWAVAFVINLWLVYRGLSRGIETFCRWAMPAMAVCAVVVLIRVLTLGTPNPVLPDQNVLNGLGFMWNPDFSRLGDFQTWLAAAGQVFFSLSVGFGIILNYSSYLRKKDDVVLSGLTASATNALFEVGFGGLITVTAAFVFLGDSGATGGTFGLGFNALPVVFAHMGGLGRWIGFVWFFMLFLAAITSSLFDAATGEGVSPGGAGLFGPACGGPSGRDVRLRIFVGSLFQRGSGRAGYDGLLGRHVCYLRVGCGSDRLFRLGDGGGPWFSRSPPGGRRSEYLTCSASSSST